MSLGDLFAFAIAVALFAIAWQVRAATARMDRFAQQLGAAIAERDSIHDTVHPAFSREQVRRARRRFEIQYRNFLQVETELFQRDDWKAKRKGEGSLPTELVEKLRSVCEEVVQSECAWKEYVWMIEGNLMVAKDRDSREAVLERFRGLLQETRGSPGAAGTLANPVKVRRVEERLSSWQERMTKGSENYGPKLELPNTSEETFDFAEAQSRHHLAMMHGL
jgi:hypothetical protein